MGRREGGWGAEEECRNPSPRQYDNNHAPPGLGEQDVQVVLGRARAYQRAAAGGLRCEEQVVKERE